MLGTAALALVVEHIVGSLTHGTAASVNTVKQRSQLMTHLTRGIGVFVYTAALKNQSMTHLTPGIGVSVNAVA